MAALVNIALPIGPTVPPGNYPPELYLALNDLYLALNNLTSQLNAGTPVMMSPNGHFWKAAISNAGTITWTDVGTLRP